LGIGSIRFFFCPADVRRTPDFPGAAFAYPKRIENGLQTNCRGHGTKFAAYRVKSATANRQVPTSERPPDAPRLTVSG
jgi:hypothetical protein